MVQTKQRISLIRHIQIGDSRAFSSAGNSFSRGDFGMKSSLLGIAVLGLAVVTIGCRQSSEVVSDAQLDSGISLNDQIVEVSCGQCQFAMEGSGCDLAIRHDGQCYYVEGSSIDDHGDARKRGTRSKEA